DRPLVLEIEAEGVGIEDRLAGDAAPAAAGDEIVLGDTVLEVVETIEAPDAERALRKEVPHLVELVARPDRDQVGAERLGEVVGDLPEVLVQLIALRELLRAGLEPGRRGAVRPGAAF